MIQPVKIVPCLLVAFVSGIGLASWLPLNQYFHSVNLFAAAALSLVTAVFVYWFAPKQLLGQAAFLLLAILASLCFGVWRYGLALRQAGPQDIDFYAGQKLELTGRIMSEPDWRPDQVKYVLSDLHLLDSRRRPLNGQLLVTASPYPAYHYSDSLRFVCQVQLPQAVDGFAYDRYLAKAGLYAVCYRPVLDLIASDQVKPSLGERGQRFLFALKDNLRQFFMANLGSDQAALASGMLLGDQKIMRLDLRQAYARSGLAHIIAISGMNMTMISSFVLLALIWLGLWRRQALWVAWLLIWLYTCLIGWPASAVRASLMSSIMLLGLAYGRPARFERLLLLVASVMLLDNPLLLRDDIGFELSFLALLGIIYFYEPLKDYLITWSITRRLPEFMLEGVALTMAAQLAALPVMANNFGQLSLVAPVANLMALPLLGPLMVLLFAVAGTASFAPPLAVVLLPALELLLTLLNRLAVIFGSSSWSILPLTAWPATLTFAYYCFMLYLAKRPQLTNRR